MAFPHSCDSFQIYKIPKFWTEATLWASHPNLVDILRIPKIHVVLPLLGNQKNVCANVSSSLIKPFLILWFCSTFIKKVFYSPSKLNSHINTFLPGNLQDLI